MIKNILYNTILICLFLGLLYSCKENVEDGYRPDYAESSASLTVTPLSYTTGAIGDTVFYGIVAKSDFDMKSIVVTSKTSGKSGSGFIIPSGTTDPLVDHIFGTLQNGTKEFSIKYQYVVSQDTVDPRIVFSLIDNQGVKRDTQVLVTIPTIARYDSIVLYSNSSDKADGFSTNSKTVYKDLSNYTDATEYNQTVQTSTDIIFMVQGSSALLLAPSDGGFVTVSSFIRNKTRFRRMQSLTSAEFDKLTSSSLYKVSRNDSIKQKGTTWVGDLKAGDLVGFFTDYGSTNSYKAGVIRVNAIHPATCSWYTGKSNMIEMDIVTQITK